MGFETDQEIIQLVGSEETFVDVLTPSLEECNAANIFTQIQALDYIGGKIRVFKRPAWAAKRPKVQQNLFFFFFDVVQVDEAREVLATVVLNHIPVKNYDFRAKCIYITLMIRRIIIASKNINHFWMTKTTMKQETGNVCTFYFSNLLKILLGLDSLLHSCLKICSRNSMQN